MGSAVVSEHYGKYFIRCFLEFSIELHLRIVRWISMGGRQRTSLFMTKEKTTERMSRELAKSKKTGKQRRK